MVFVGRRIRRIRDLPWEPGESLRRGLQAGPGRLVPCELSGGLEALARRGDRNAPAAVYDFIISVGGSGKVAGQLYVCGSGVQDIVDLVLAQQAFLFQSFKKFV